MSPNMVAALKAAAAADAVGGLQWFKGAGWAKPGDERSHHGPVVISRLVRDRGYLAEAGAKGRGKNSRRVITATGRAALDELLKHDLNVSSSLQRLVDLVEDELWAMDEACGPRPQDTRSSWWERRTELLKRLEDKLTTEEGAHFSSYISGYDYRLQMAGIRSSSTSGWHGALRNWQTAARKRIAKGAA